MFTTLFVVDDDSLLSLTDLSAISFDSYLHNYPKLGEPKMRIINLCDTDQYLGQGYYCSLLAQSRHHDVLPSIKVINKMRSGTDILWFERESFKKQFGDISVIHTQIVCMGQIANNAFQKLASRIFQEFPAPILEITLQDESGGVRVDVVRKSLRSVTRQEFAYCHSVLQQYSRSGWQRRGSSKKYRWDIALLTDPQEAVPPSNKGAITRFIKAGEKLGLRVQNITANELNHLNQFDGLFIRETTAIDHHTYRLASKAEELGLIVIDDPDSILRCCNKVFLHDAFMYQKVPSLKTLFVSRADEATLETLQNAFDFPLVLKMPEGSFSKGVYKVEDKQSLQLTLENLLTKSALVLAQEYMYTAFDWRVGVLNGRALYACRYYMARNHWQIYNHQSKRNFSGGFDTLPTFELPRNVLDAALKAAAVVGNGLYGIDIKEVDGRAYVLEVNDNPSIDYAIEDKYLGEELYMQIMSEFLRRLELRGR